MKVSLQHDPELDAWHLHTECTLATEEDVETWRRNLVKELKAIGERVYLVIDIADFEVHPKVANAYGRVAKEVARQYTLGIVRYGPSKGTTATSVRLEAVVHRFPANIFPDREQAVAALRKIKQLPA